MRCQGGPNSGRFCYNPFSTAWLNSDPETGELLPEYRPKSSDNPDENCDPALGEISASCAWNTSTEVRYAGLILREDVRKSQTHIVDFAVSNGSLFDLWYNDKPVGVAAGIHFRVEAEEQQPNQISEALWGSAKYVAQQTEEETRAALRGIADLPPSTIPTGVRWRFRSPDGMRSSRPAVRSPVRARPPISMSRSRNLRPATDSATGWPFAGVVPRGSFSPGMFQPLRRGGRLHQPECVGARLHLRPDAGDFPLHRGLRRWQHDGDHHG